MQLQTPDEVRGFLRLCLDPGPGRPKRTAAELARIMPDALGDAVSKHAPELAVLRAELKTAETAATEARERYSEGLRAWIANEGQTS
ncbi:hypothetical protein ACLQ2N_16490 [Streptomyces sp. DT224]|uniref:hypothetical protein n=1 Tax=Streptomyces sp. DT224 TaxID=3393426 RepID=UPI003CE91849